jgi:tetratricopeptide (TPR) repeat protein
LDEALEGFRAACAFGESLIAEHPQALDDRATLCGVRGNLGRLLSQMGRYEEAEAVVRAQLADYEQLAAIDSKPRWDIWRARTMVRLSQICGKRGDREQSKKLCEEAVVTADRVVETNADKHGPLSAAAWFFAACQCESLCDSRKAVRIAKDAARLAPDSAEAARALGLALFRSGDGPGAVNALLKARKLFRQRDHVTNLILALAYDQAGSKTVARREYERACRLIDETREQSEDLDWVRAEADRKFAKRDA